MLWSGRPEIKQIERVLDDANLLKVFPTDDELEVCIQATFKFKASIV